MRRGPLISALLLVIGIIMMTGAGVLATLTGRESAGFVLGTVPKEIDAGMSMFPKVSISSGRTDPANFTVWYSKGTVCSGSVSKGDWNAEYYCYVYYKTFAMTAPSEPGTYTLTVKVTQAGETWSGSTNGTFTVIDTTPPPPPPPPPPPLTYTLTTTVNPLGSGTVSPSSGTYDEGASVTITAYPNQGYKFSNWSGGISGSTNPATVTMNSNKAITANFAELARYTLTTNAYPLGAGSVSPSSGEYAAGESVTVTAYPSDEYVFDRWGGDASGTAVSTTIVMNSNKAVIAYFESAPPTTYNLAVSISPASGGYVNPDAGTFEEGALVTLTATAYSEYEFDYWSGDVAGSSETITVKMDSDKSIVANFKELPSVAPSNLFLYIGIALTAFGVVGLVVTTKRR